ncbi:MAG: phage portal protein family protein [Planctomycetota bacterium]
MRLPDSIWRLPRDVRGEVLRFAAEVDAAARRTPSLGERTRHGRPFLTGLTASFVGPYRPGAVAVEAKKRMRRDPQIALGLAAIKAPVLHVAREGGWWIEGRNEEIVDVVAELMRPLVRPLVRSCLNAVEFGHQAHEKVWELRPLGSGATLYAYRKLKDLEPGTFELYADEHGRYAGLAQPHMDAPIPPGKTFVMTLDREWGNLYGRGRLDAAYEPWYWSSVIYQFANRYFERKADPVVKAYAPPEVRPDPRTGAEEHNLDALNDELASLRSSGSIALPDERDEHGNRRWDVEYLLDDQRGQMFRDYIEHLDTKKLRALFVPERSLTQDGSVGSHAAARQYADTFLLMESGLLVDLVGQINEHVIRPLVEVNFGAAALGEQVRLVTAGISRRNEETLVDVLRLAVEAEKTGGKTAELIDRVKLLAELNVPTDGANSK